MMNYLAILLPLTFGYMANYYALKHEHRMLEYKYIQLVRRTMSENQEKIQEILKEETVIDGGFKVIPMPDTQEMHELTEDMANATSDIERTIIFGKIQHLMAEFNKKKGKI